MRLRALASLCLLSAAAPGAAVFPGIAGAWEYAAGPDSLSPPLECVRMTIVTPDSARLAAWYVPAQDSAGAMLSGPHPGVLLLPGDRDLMDERLHVVAGLARRGFSVLTFDHRGRGGSSDFFIDRRALNYPEFLEDAHNALFILRRQADVDSAKLAVYGESRGAWLALALAAERPELRAVVAVSPPFNPQSWLPILQREQPDEAFFLPKAWKRRWDPDKVVDRFNGAILFVSGDRDLVTPAWMAEDLFKRYPRAKDIWIVEGAAHDGPKGPSRFGGEMFLGRVSEFLTRELDRPPHRGWPER